MRLNDYVGMAVHQLRKNRMRTILTIIGIMIGVASMITVISVSDGGKEMINEELLKFGINRVWFFPSNIQGPNNMLDLADVNLLKSINGIEDVAPSAYEKAYLSYQNKKVVSDVVGTNEALFDMEQMSYLEGRGLTENDIDYLRRVVVLSEEAKKTLFGDSSAEGKKVSINGQKFTVVGVEKEDQSIYASFFSGKCYMPMTTFKSMFSSKYFDEISVTASSAETLDDVIDTSVSLLLKKYGEGTLKIINLSNEISNAQNIQDRSRRRCGCCSAGRRYRHHEHNAGHCKGTHPRDRHKKSSRRRGASHTRAVSCRSLVLLDSGRSAWHRHRCIPDKNIRERHWYQSTGFGLGCVFKRFVFCQCGYNFRTDTRV
jgi:hypothetical protein